MKLHNDTVMEQQGLDLGNTAAEARSTTTPVVSGDNVYVATNGSDPTTWAAVGTVKRINKDFVSNIETDADKNRDTDENKIVTIYNGAGVQCSPVVYRNGTTDFVYFTTNVSNGTGYCYRVLTTGTAMQWWEAPSGNYSLQGFAAGDGFMTFGNDGNEIIIVK